MRGNNGNGNGGKGPAGNAKPHLFTQIEEDGADTTSLIGLGLQADLQDEGVLRRVSRTGAQLLDIGLAVFVLAFVTPLHRYREENTLGLAMICLALGLLLTAAVSTARRASRLLNNSWVGIRSLFHLAGLGVSGMYLHDAYTYSLNGDAPRDPIPQTAFYPLVFFLITLALSFTSYRRLDPNLARGYAVQEDKDDPVFKNDEPKGDK